MAVRDYVAKYVADLTGYKLTPAIRETDQLERATDQTADAIVADWRRAERGTDQASRAMAADADHAGKQVKAKLGEAGAEAGSEFASNLGESISSGDTAGLLSGTVGGLAASFGATGPIGLALAGLATVAVTVFGQMQAAAEKAKQAAEDAFEELVNGADKQERLRNRVTMLYGDMTDGMETLRRLSEDTGVSMEAIGTALADGGPAASNLARELERIEAAHSKTVTDTRGNRRIVLDEDGQAAHDLRVDMEKTAEATGRAAANAQTYRDALKASAALAKTYATAGSSYAGSMYASQLGAAYSRGGRG